MKIQTITNKILLIFILNIISLNLVYAQSIKLSWSPNPEADIEFYKIYRDITSNPENEIARIFSPASNVIFFISGHACLPAKKTFLCFRSMTVSSKYFPALNLRKMSYHRPGCIPLPYASIIYFICFLVPLETIALGLEPFNRKNLSFAKPHSIPRNLS